MSRAAGIARIRPAPCRTCARMRSSVQFFPALGPSLSPGSWQLPQARVRTARPRATDCAPPAADAAPVGRTAGVVAGVIAGVVAAGSVAAGVAAGVAGSGVVVGLVAGGATVGAVSVVAVGAVAVSPLEVVTTGCGAGVDVLLEDDPHPAAKARRDAHRRPRRGRMAADRITSRRVLRSVTATVRGA